ncbi:hypothetical protein J3458_000992 [Metarhizium acridum]|uniref:uncharacterized protein n=1 Tax=Metarhizium acridum TaxID=92637 RepID=UPI001C6C394B|nr:hypothetical protein J3458_000992 [Metarhizium acridum]
MLALPTPSFADLGLSFQCAVLCVVEADDPYAVFDGRLASTNSLWRFHGGSNLPRSPKPPIPRWHRSVPVPRWQQLVYNTSTVCHTRVRLNGALLSATIDQPHRP